MSDTKPEPVQVLGITANVGLILQQGAERRGVSVAELIRWVLGTWAIGEMQVGAEIRYPPPAVGPPEPPLDIMTNMGKMMRMGAAMMGQLNCQSCTQRLSMTDAEKGSCSRCEAPIG